MTIHQNYFARFAAMTAEMHNLGLVLIEQLQQIIRTAQADIRSRESRYSEALIFSVTPLISLSSSRVVVPLGFEARNSALIFFDSLSE